VVHLWTRSHKATFSRYGPYRAGGSRGRSYTWIPVGYSHMPLTLPVNVSLKAPVLVFVQLLSVVAKLCNGEVKKMGVGETKLTAPPPSCHRPDWCWSPCSLLHYLSCSPAPIACTLVQPFCTKPNYYINCFLSSSSPEGQMATTWLLHAYIMRWCNWFTFLLISPQIVLLLNLHFHTSPNIKFFCSNT